MQVILASLPLDTRMTVQITPPTGYPGEPGLAAI